MSRLERVLVNYVKILAAISILLLPFVPIVGAVIDNNYWLLLLELIIVPIFILGIIIFNEELG